jgi:hypothetical protein
VRLLTASLAARGISSGRSWRWLAKLILLDEGFAIVRLDPDGSLPAWASPGALTSVTWTSEELSVVCAEGRVPPDLQAERGWRCLRVAGSLDFSLTGVLAAIASPLAAARVSIFALSTYETDYVLVRGEQLGLAIESLKAAGHAVTT